MNENLKQKLENWAKLKNWHGSHPADSDRFFDFIIDAYQENKENGSDIDVDEFIQVVRSSADFDLKDTDIEQRYAEYEFGLQLLTYLKK